MSVPHPSTLKQTLVVGLWCLVFTVPWLSLVDMILALLVFPAGGSNAWGVLHLALELTRYHLLAGAVCLPIVAVSIWFTRRRWPLDSLLNGLERFTLAGSMALIASASGKIVWDIPNRDLLEFPGIVVVYEICVMCAVGLGTLWSYRHLTEILSRIRKARPEIIRRNSLLSISWVAASLGCVVLAHVVAAPVYEHRIALLLGLTSSVALLLPMTLLYSDARPQKVWPPLAVVVVLLLSFPVSQNPHARLVLFGHVPIGGAYGIVWRNLTDWDGDGTTAQYLGGADCAPFNANVSPLFREVAGDKIDQDCRGGDAAPGVKVGRARLLDECVLPSEPLSSVVLITIDALRADAINEVVAPHLFRLGRVMRNYQRAYAPSASTVGTTLGIATGMYLSDLNPIRLNGPSLEVPTGLVESLHHQGFATAVFIPFDLLPAVSRGADLGKAPWLDWQTFGAKRLVLSAGLLKAALDFSLKGTPARPTFVWTHIPDLHAPYPAGLLGNRPELSPYDQGLAYLDARLDQFLRAMNEQGHLARSLVIITADHGEQLGQRGREGHGSLFFEEGIRVPLLIHLPGCSPEISVEPVSLLGIRELIERVTGRAPLGEGSPDHQSSGPVIVEEAELAALGIKRAVIDARFKLIEDLQNGGRMGFDLEADPFESNDLLAETPTAFSSLNDRYQVWLDAKAR